MSFSSDIKEKLCETEYKCGRCAAAEIAGALAFGGSAENGSVKFTTENAAAAKRISTAIYESFGIKVPVTASSKIHKVITDDIYQAENIIGGIPQKGDIPFSCCREAYVRGAFLGGGSVTDPKKGYHIEYDTRNKESAERLKEILAAAGFDTRITERKNRYAVYAKGSEEIADILSYMGATQGALELFSIQVEKDMRNSVNRWVNCENANTNKSAMATSKQLIAIKKIKQAGQWGKLPEALRETATLREEYPEDSLKELSQRTSPPIGKSGINHRLKKLLEIAEGI